MSDVVLEVKEISKGFPGVQALKDVSIELRRHEVLGLVGENGAGKSTLLKILVGLYVADSGDIILRGKKISPRDIKEAGDYGIGMVFQEQSLLPNLTVAENIFLGNEEPFMRFGVINGNKMQEAARGQLAKVHSNIDPATYTADLDFAERQMVELAKVMTIEERTHHEPIILLDEPTSVLDQEEIDILFERIRLLKKRASIVFVSHRLDEVLAVSDRIYVMKDSKVVTALDAKVAEVRQLHQLMVGRGLQAEYYRESKQRSHSPEVVLRVENLSRAGFYQGVSFELHRGEILGICGVIGSGREEVCRTLFGLMQPDAGEIYLDGRSRNLRNPSDAVAAGVGYVPQERRTEGLILFLGVAPNITLSSLERIIQAGLINYKKEWQTANTWIKKLTIKTPSLYALCLNLSGGNQQKVVLARSLAANVKILILDHPTRGLDVGAKEEVYELIRELSNQGMAILLTADTLEEAIGLSHSVLVMKDGKVTKKFEAPPGKKPQQVELIECMV